MNPTDPPARAKAVRLTFRYAGDQVQLVSQQPVDMVIPPSAPVQGPQPAAAFWADVRDAQDATVYRRVMHDPIPRDVEVFSPDPQESVARVPAPPPTGLFTVLVPATDQGETVALLSADPAAGPGPAAAAAGPREVARVRLQKS